MGQHASSASPSWFRPLAAPRRLLSHQERVLEWAVPRSRIALFLQMRLGKSLVTIRWVQERVGPGASVLVVCPLPTILSWERELSLEGEPIQVLDGPVKTRDSLARGGHWNLINYDGLAIQGSGGHLVPLADFEWDAVIFDESTRFRNPKASTTKAVHRFQDAKNLAILSGCPAPEGQLDFFSQMALLENGTFMECNSYWNFRARYFRQVGYDWVPYPGFTEKLKTAVGEKAYVLSRKDAGLGSVKIRERRYCQMGAAQKSLQKEIKKDFRVAAGQFTLETVETKWTLNTIAWLHRLAGGFHPTEKHLISDVKLKLLVSLLETELAEIPVLIWCRFDREIHAVSIALQKAGITTTSITGATSQEYRRKLIENFNAGRTRTLVLQLKVGTFGLDLSHGDASIYYSNWFENEIRLQTEDRIVHPNKTRPALYVDLLTRGSIDEDILDSLEEKEMKSRFSLTDVLRRFFNRAEAA